MQQIHYMDLFGFDERQREIANQIMPNYHVKVIDAAHMDVNEIKKYKNEEQGS